MCTVVSTVMGTGTQESTKEGAWPSLRGQKLEEDQEGFLEEAVSQLRLRLPKHVNESLGFVRRLCQ